MKIVDADAVMEDICSSIRAMTAVGIAVDAEYLWGKLNDALDNAPIIEAVPKNMIFHVEVYDDMTEEYSLKEMTLGELLNKFTDEGYPYMEEDESDSHPEMPKLTKKEEWFLDGFCHNRGMTIKRSSQNVLSVCQYTPFGENTIMIDSSMFLFISAGEEWNFQKLFSLEVIEEC